jgi:hypothetical protein
MWSKGARGGAAGRIPARPAAGVAEKVDRGSRSCRDPTWGLTHGREAAGGRVWRVPAAAAAWSFAPASLQLGVANKRAWELYRCTREAGAARVCGERRLEVEFTVSTDGRQWRLGGAVFPHAKDGEALL